MAEFRFSHSVRVRDIPPAGKKLRLVADETERAELAERLGISAVERLTADFELAPAKGSVLRMRGTLESDVIQTCIVTLEPVPQTVNEAFDVVFLPAEEGDKDDPKTVLLDPLEDEDSEFYHNGRLDLGRIVAEHLALGLDPYPRVPSTDFPGHKEGDTSDRVSPFQSLKTLTDKKS